LTVLVVFHHALCMYSKTEGGEIEAEVGSANEVNIVAAEDFAGGSDGREMATLPHPDREDTERFLRWRRSWHGGVPI
jgi:hypothetical protein